MFLSPNTVPLRNYARFHSDEHGQPFERCIRCRQHLLTEPVHYIIEKAYRQRPAVSARELLFEFAICRECHAAIEDTFSIESLEHIDQFYAEHIDHKRRAEKLLDRNSGRAGSERDALVRLGSTVDISDWVGACMVTGTPVEELEEYQLIARGIGRSLVLGVLPGVLGHTALDELIDGLSDRTIGEARRFRDEYLNVPPDVKELLHNSFFV